MIIHCDTTRYIFEVLEGQEYKFLFEDLVVFDVGCNIGAFSLWMLPHAKQIYAVDRSEEHTALFRKTIADNALDKVKVFTAQIAGEDGEHDTYSLAGFMSGNNIRKVDILKLDVEGAELEIVNAPDFPADKIKTIIGEHHYTDHRRDEFEKRLVVLGYTYVEYPNNHFKATR